MLWYCVEPGPQNQEWEVYASKTLALDACTSPVVPTWETVPILVTAEPELEVRTLKAIKTWNLWMGFELFQYTDDQSKPDIVVFYVAPHPIMSARVGQYTIDGKHVGAVLVYEKGVEVRTLAHEFGHLLGLAHEHGNHYNVMSYDRDLVWITPSDKAILLRQYRYR